MERIGLSSGGNKVRERLEIENNLKFDKDYPYGYPWPPRYYTCSFCQREFKSAQALGGHMNIHRRDRARLRDLSPPPSTTTTTNNNNIDDQNPNFNSNPNTNPNPNPNPNPNIDDQNPNLSYPSSTSSSNIYTHQYSLVSLSLSSLPPPIMNRNSEMRGSTIMGSIDGLGRDYYEQRVGKWKYMSSSCEHHHENGVRVDLNNNYNGVSTKEMVRLDLELCLGEAKEDLDLELRLGI